MKKTLISIAAVLLCLSAAAQTEKIEKLNSNMQNVEALFTQTKTLSANGKKVNADGVLYFEAPDKMALKYSEPSTDRFVINGEQLYIAKGKKRNKYDTKKNATMRQLSSTLLNCTMGKLETVAAENNADISVKENGSMYDVVLKARKKAAKGYSEIALSYRKTDGVLCSMKLVEFNENITEYKFSAFKINTILRSGVFNIPLDLERKAKTANNAIVRVAE